MHEDSFLDPKSTNLLASLWFCGLFYLAPGKTQAMGPSSKTSSRAGVTGVGFMLIRAISNLQCKFEVVSWWLELCEKNVSVFAAVSQKNCRA